MTSHQLRCKPFFVREPGKGGGRGPGVNWSKNLEVKLQVNKIFFVTYDIFYNVAIFFFLGEKPHPSGLSTSVHQCECILQKTFNKKLQQASPLPFILVSSFVAKNPQLTPYPVFVQSDRQFKKFFFLSPI